MKNAGNPNPPLLDLPLFEDVMFLNRDLECYYCWENRYQYLRIAKTTVDQCALLPKTDEDRRTIVQEYIEDFAELRLKCLNDNDLDVLVSRMKTENWSLEIHPRAGEFNKLIHRKIFPLYQYFKTLFWA